MDTLPSYQKGEKCVKARWATSKRNKQTRLYFPGAPGVQAEAVWVGERTSEGQEAV